MGTLDLAYGPQCVFGYTSARACVYSFIALMNLFGFDENTHEAVDCGSYASAAQSAVPQIIEEMTVDGLQSLIVLVSEFPSAMLKTAILGMLVMEEG